MENINSKVPIVILAGGYGIYIDDSGVRQSKANVLVDGKPLIYYIIRSYLSHGFNQFIVSGSYQLKQTEDLLSHLFKDQKISLKFVDSGLDTKTGDRLKKVFEHLKDCEHFGVTYSDSVSLQDLNEELIYHKSLNNIATLTGARLPTRFRVVGIRPSETTVRGFSDKVLFKGDYVNGGFYFFNSSILKNKIWNTSSEIILEITILDSLIKENSLSCFFHDGQWAYLDCERDLKNIGEYCQIILNKKSIDNCR